MSEKQRLALIVAATALAVFFGAACGTSSTPRQDPSASVTPVDGGGTPTAAPLLVDSAAKFDQVASYRLRFTLRLPIEDVTVEGDAAYRARDAVYARTGLAGASARMAGGGVAAYLFLPPDLYLQEGNGGWFVQSPWNQGIRPGQEQDIGLRQPIIDFKDLSAKLRQVELRSDESVGGHGFKRLSGSVSLVDLPWLAAGRPNATASVEIWIGADTSLPGKITIQTYGPGPFLATIEYADYNQSFTPPAPPDNARPVRDVLFPDAPCTAAALAACLEAQGEISGTSACSGAGRRVCLVPLGRISSDLVNYLVAYYRDQYSLSVTILTPAAIPASLEDPLRQQVDAARLISYMGSLFPDAYRDPQAVLIGITPIDLYDSTSYFRYVFGLKGTPSNPKAVVSAVRMNPQFYSEPFDGPLYYARTGKLLSKYIGLLYYGLPASSDAQSPMFDSILGPADIDRMTKPLPIGGAR